MFSFDLFHSLRCEESDDLVKSGGDGPHVVDPWPAKNHVVGRGTVEHYKSDMEVDSGCVDWRGDVPQCELLLATESD